MARDRLLSEITALPHSARYRRLREAGREARINPKVEAALNDWERGDWQQRLYCVQSCTGSGDTVRLHRMTDDPSRTVANHALHLLADHGSDEVVVNVLAKLPRARRLRLLARLRSRRRLTAIDSFLTEGFAESLPRIAELLPYGSSQAVNRHFRKAEECGGSLFWARLARSHPRIAAKAIVDKLAATEQPDGLLLLYARNVVLYAGRTEPDLTVRLVKALAQFTPLSYLQVTHTLFQRPNELAAIVLESEGSTPFSLAPVARKIESSVLKKILQERPAALPFQTNWFRKIPASERATIFQEVGRSWRDAEGLLPCDVLTLLPSKERIAEAERIAALPILATRPQTQAAYAAYLPWAKMREIADRFLTHPEGESRAWGWAAVLGSLRFNRDQASNVLAMIRKRKFEQDPVRLIILQSLAGLPQGIWKAAHLVEIAGVVREALDATDLSYSSAVYLTAFVQKLIPTHPNWAAEQLVTIYSERGNIGGYYLETRINDQQALTLAKAFVDVGTRWGRGNRVGWLVWFASALGKRLRVCEDLLKILEGLLGKESGHFDASILQLLRKQLPHAEFERLASHLITADESWVALLPIFMFLHRHRQDWLEPFLSKSKFRMKGGSTVELVNLLQPSGYHRYTLGQQSVLAGTLNAIIRLPADNRLPNDVWTMLRAMSFLAELPAVDPSRLIELSNDTRPVIADAAIRALGRLDAGQGVPTLITALGDNRARLAIYALRQAMAVMPAKRVIADLQDAPMDKVTVAKETIRLIGEFGGAAGFDWLLARARQDLHRDVRIAVLRGLWDHLEHPEAWAILTEAAQSTDGQILNGVVRIPADRLSDGSRRKLIDLLAGLARHPDVIIRLTVLRRFIEMPLPENEGRLIQTALASLTAASSDEREVAAKVIATNSSANDAPRIADIVGKMRDQRRPLHDFVRFVTADALADAPKRRRLEPMARLVLESLRVDPITAGLRLKFAAGILGADGFEQELQKLVDDAFPISAIIQEATAAIEQIGQTTKRSQLAEVENRLASSDDPHLRLLAFIALLTQAGDHKRWDDARRGRLAGYRNDPAPLVAIRAQYCFDADSA
jgi:hypothetical protein